MARRCLVWAVLGISTAPALLACTGYDSTWTDPVTGMEFVRVESGTFSMGLRADEPVDLRAAPLHEVGITSSFWLARTEVSQAQWEVVMGTRPSYFAACGADCPVEGVSWHDVQGFLRALSAGRAERFRLPTEAEWEYACRAGTTRRYGVADTLTAALARFDATVPFEGRVGDAAPDGPAPVASFPPNPWGLHDLNGNVWEWVADEFCPYGEGPRVDPVGRCGTDTIPIRGGSWRFSASAARCGRRYTHHRDDSGYSLGFRVVREDPGR